MIEDVFDGWVLVVGMAPMDVKFVMYRTKAQAAKVAAAIAVAGAEVHIQGFSFVPEDVPLYSQ